MKTCCLTLLPIFIYFRKSHDIFGVWIILICITGWGKIYFQHNSHRWKHVHVVWLFKLLSSTYICTVFRALQNKSIMIVWSIGNHSIRFHPFRCYFRYVHSFIELWIWDLFVIRLSMFKVLSSLELMRRHLMENCFSSWKCKQKCRLKVKVDSVITHDDRIYYIFFLSGAFFILY